MHGDAYSVKSVWQRSPAHIPQARCSFSFKNVHRGHDHLSSTTTTAALGLDADAAFFFRTVFLRGLSLEAEDAPPSFLPRPGRP